MSIGVFQMSLHFAFYLVHGFLGTTELRPLASCLSSVHCIYFRHRVLGTGEVYTQ
jgi:hypothetical protein